MVRNHAGKTLAPIQEPRYLRAFVLPNDRLEAVESADVLRVEREY